jgi:DNA primase
MRFSPQFLDELRARLPVSEVVGRRVKLRKAGREWKGLSPFNKEKTPSFFVNDQKAMWFDFSSGKNGNIFDFVMATEGVSFPEAVERLAGQAGVPLPVMTREAAEHEERRKTLHDIVELAAKFFEANLASRAGARGRGYFADRGITAATQLKFRLGYAGGEQYALKEHLGALKISTDDMVEAGLLVAGEDIAVPYDRFRDRVMFPISDWRGRVVAFGGRALDKDVPAKYLNSPETPLFHKGATLYNIAAARTAAHNAGKSGEENFASRVIAVEGYIDAIAMVTAGYEATVAPLGTALTADQLALMWRMADEPILCFDGDDAGRRAAYRALDLALPLIKPGTISCARAGATRSRMCSRPRVRSPTCCGRARAKPARCRHRSGAPRSRRGWPKSCRPSLTKPCAVTTAPISPSVCAAYSRRRRCRRTEVIGSKATGMTKAAGRSRQPATFRRAPALAATKAISPRVRNWPRARYIAVTAPPCRGARL